MSTICTQAVGKSTFARFLTNYLMTAGADSRSIAFLDLDIGQPELGPPGMLSLHVVTAPLVSPPHAHMQPAARSFYFGDVSPKVATAAFTTSVYCIVLSHAFCCCCAE